MKSFYAIVLLSLFAFSNCSKSKKNLLSNDDGMLNASEMQDKSNKIIEFAEELQEPTINQKPVLKRDEEVSIDNSFIAQHPVMMSNSQIAPPLTCQDGVIGAFQITPSIQNSNEPEKATHGTLDFCRKNKKTCCNEEQLNGIAAAYYKSYQDLVKAFEIFEEAMSIFIGPKFEQEILSQITLEHLNKKEECAQYAKNPLKTESLKDPINFSPELESIQFQMNELRNLLSETAYYVKRQGWFYGNLICTACNPADHEYIKVEGHKVTLTASHSTCLEIFDMKEYEYRMMTAFTKFLVPAANTYKCMTATEKEPFGEDQVIKPTKIEEIIENNKNYRFCFEEFDHETEVCQKQCEKDLHEIQIPGDELDLMLDVVKVFFPVLTGVELEDYYTTIKNRPLENNPTKASFFPKDSIQLEMVYEKAGIHIFNNHWSKKFLEMSFDEPEQVEEIKEAEMIE